VFLFSKTLTEMVMHPATGLKPITQILIIYTRQEKIKQLIMFHYNVLRKAIHHTTVDFC
jgi:hypothetical protein